MLTILVLGLIISLVLGGTAAGRRNNGKTENE